MAQRRIARIHRRDPPLFALFDQEAGLELGNQSGPHQRRFAAAGAADQGYEMRAMKLLQQLDRLFAPAEIEQRLVAVEGTQADKGICRQGRELEPERSGLCDFQNGTGSLCHMLWSAASSRRFGSPVSAQIFKIRSVDGVLSNDRVICSKDYQSGESSPHSKVLRLREQRLQRLRIAEIIAIQFIDR